MEEKLGLKISRAVERCRFRTEPRSGDCGNVAAALMEFLDDADLISVSTERDKHNSAHFCVRINGNLYDGYGRTSPEEMVEIFAEDENCQNPTEYLHEVHSVRSENYILFPEVKNQIIENLESELDGIRN